MEIFVSHQEFADLPSKSVCATAIEDRNTAVRTMSMSTIPAATTSVASRSPQHGQRQQHQRGVEMEMVRRASGPNTRTATTGLGIVASATAAPAPASSLEAPPFPASLGAPIAESLDLARLLASVGSSLLPGEALSAASAPALGASAQAPVGRGVVEVAGAAVEGGTGSAGQLRLRDLGLGGDGDVDIMNTNPQNRQSMQMQSDIHTAGTAADIITATAPPPSLYSQWASRGRGGGGRSTEARRAGPRTPHMIAVTAPHCEEEVILAISNIH